MTDPGLWVIYGYLALVGGTWAYVRIRSRWRDRQAADLAPDDQPGTNNELLARCEAIADPERRTP